MFEEKQTNIDSSWVTTTDLKTAKQTFLVTPKQPQIKNLLLEILKALGIFVTCFLFIYLFLTFPAYWAKGKYYWNKFSQRTSSSLNIPASLDQTSNDIFLDTIKDALEKSPAKKSIKKYSVDISDLENNFLIISKIAVKAPIIWQVAPDEDLMLKNLQNGVVHYNGTALPNEDQGNVFISGHSSYYWWDKGNYKTVFANLDKLENGDEIALAYQDKVYIYQVREKIVVKPQQTEVLMPTEKPILSLMTCVPVGTNLKRLVVKAERLQITSAAAEKEQEELQKLEESQKQAQDKAQPSQPAEGKTKSLDQARDKEKPKTETKPEEIVPPLERTPLELLPWVD